MNANEQRHLLDSLQSLLEKQIETARKGDFRYVEALAEQAGHTIEELTKIKQFEQSELDSRHKHLMKLYKKLELILAAEKISVEKQLKQVGNVRKILRVYHNNG